MKHSVQPYFPGFQREGTKTFGGSFLKGNAKTRRPIATKRAMHLVLRSEMAKGEFSFLKGTRPKQISNLIHRLEKRTGVRVFRFANAGNHLHLLVQPKSRKAYHQFIRALSGLIARLVLKRERGVVGVRGKTKVKFWDQRPYSILVEWGTHYRRVAKYLLQNTLEALGFTPYRKRTKKDARMDQPPKPLNRIIQ